MTDPGMAMNPHTSRFTIHGSLRLWPRSLLWRSVLLIALLLIIANLAWLQIVRVSEREPRAHQAALQIVSVVNLTRAALITAQPSKRYDLLTELSQREGIQIYLPEPRETLAPLPDRPFIQLLAAELRRNLGPETRMTLTRNGVRGVWVSFAIDEDEYWVFMPRSRVERNDSLRWIGWGALVLLLALVGSYLIVARINRPLRQLTRAAARMGRGVTPAPVSETGPTEIRTVARAFNQLAADLKRLDDERALLLAGVSHDLRTPLSRIRLGIELLDDRGDTVLKEGLEEDISEIDKAIGQFLDFARLTQPEAVTQESDLNALVETVVSRYGEGPHNIGFDSSPVPALPLRRAAMQRLVVNLIENALRHGGAEVSVATGCDAGNAWIEVRDRGPGIPAVDAERMLQPFTRLDSARGGASGTGLGLAIVDRIARMHGGRVRLLPRPGGGLIARVELPLPPRGAQVETPPHPARQAA